MGYSTSRTPKTIAQVDLLLNYSSSMQTLRLSYWSDSKSLP